MRVLDALFTRCARILNSVSGLRHSTPARRLNPPGSLTPSAGEGPLVHSACPNDAATLSELHRIPHAIGRRGMGNSPLSKGKGLCSVPNIRSLSRGARAIALGNYLGLLRASWRPLWASLGSWSEWSRPVAGGSRCCVPPPSPGKRARGGFSG